MTICSIVRTLINTSTPGHSGAGSNGNEGIPYTPQIFTTKDLQSDKV